MGAEKVGAEQALLPLHFFDTLAGGMCSNSSQKCREAPDVEL
jgi:hypothetical protein